MLMAACTSWHVGESLTDTYVSVIADGTRQKPTERNPVAIHTDFHCLPTGSHSRRRWLRRETDVHGIQFTKCWVAAEKSRRFGMDAELCGWCVAGRVAHYNSQLLAGGFQNVHALVVSIIDDRNTRETGFDDICEVVAILHNVTF